MQGELNDLSFNNTKVTFSNTTNNIATSDELLASAAYQDKMGTNYSKSKKVSKVGAATGIALLVTAASIRAGTVMTNGFVLNPPKANVQTAEVVEGVFHYLFTIENKGKYQTTYFISVNNKVIVSKDCSEAKEYEGHFSEFKENDSCKFYISFTNKVDYTKTIKEIRFNTGGVIL